MAVTAAASSSQRRTHLLRNLLGIAVLALALAVLLNKRHDLTSASHILARLDWRWMVLAVGAEAASMVVFARLQRWLLRAGGVRMGLRSMIEITLAGNALGTTLPGGAAWSATWAFGQLRRRGADRVLSGWVILVAGALASFALFVLLAVGSFVAGSKGPVADLRPLAAVLAAIPVAVGIGAVVLARWPALRARLRHLWEREARHPRVKSAEGALGRLWARILTVRPSRLGWLGAFSLALANWVWDAVALAACILALGGGVPWRGVLVAYALTQIAASFPITPGGLGVVEGSLAALLVAYGMPVDRAVAATLLYRLVSFWALVPIGWAVWSAIELSQRRGERTRSHPWAAHVHGPAPANPALGRQGFGRIVPPEPCFGCSDPEDEVSSTPAA
ncbi:MAG TPA: lysylphosphatidylglycerol synthase transmembrane domain-containing protein [Acidimicrobiales bacterium]